MLTFENSLNYRLRFVSSTFKSQPTGYIKESYSVEKTHEMSNKIWYQTKLQANESFKPAQLFPRKLFQRRFRAEIPENKMIPGEGCLAPTSVGDI